MGISEDQSDILQYNLTWNVKVYSQYHAYKFHELLHVDSGVQSEKGVNWGLRCCQHQIYEIYFVYLPHFPFTRKANEFKFTKLNF